MRLLDTNVVRHLLDPRARHPKLIERISQIVREDGRALLSELTVYEIRRGLAELELRGLGQRTRRVTELFLRTATIVALSGSFEIAAKMWAQARVAKPAIVLSDADLLLLATALRDGLTLVTADAKLHRALRRLGVDGHVELVPLA